MFKSAALSLLAALAISAPGLAEARRPVVIVEGQEPAVGFCSIEATVNYFSAHIIIGAGGGEGTGMITCNYGSHIEELPVAISTGRVGLGFGVQNIQFRMIAAGLGLMNGGTLAFTGDYAVINAGAQFVTVGGELGVGLTLSRNGFSIPATIVAKTGAGLEVAVSVGGMSIRPL